MDNTTQAFNKYVDPIFVIQNDLQPYVKKEETDGYYFQSEMKLNTYEDEKDLRLGICFKLFKDIEEILSFKTTKEQYKKVMLKLGSSDIDYIELNKKKNKYNNILMTHAKLMYLSKYYMLEIPSDYYIKIVGCLAILYSKITGEKRKQNPYTTFNIPFFSKTNLYKYIKEANLEECNFDIKNYSKYSIQELMEKVFEIAINSMYELNNFTHEPMAVIEKDKDGYDYYETEILHVHIIEENNSFEKFKRDCEEEVYDWLVDEMHKLEDGKTF